MTQKIDNDVLDVGIIQETLDPRIKRNLEQLNDYSDELNNTTTELTDTKERLGCMVTKIEYLLMRYYTRHKRWIERTRNYLQSLLNLKLETDSFYVHVMEYDASVFALEQCRTICNRLEDDIINSKKNNDMDICIESLHLLNETNEKLDHWITKTTEQAIIKNESIYELNKVYECCVTEIKRFKLYRYVGLLYFHQKLFFYKCIRKVMDYINILQNIVSEMNTKYNDILAGTKNLTIELQHKDGSIHKIDDNQPVNSTKQQCDFVSCVTSVRAHYRQSINHVINTIFNMDNICIKHKRYSLNNDDIQSNKCYLMKFNNFISNKHMNSCSPDVALFSYSQNEIIDGQNIFDTHIVSTTEVSCGDNNSKANDVDIEFNELDINDPNEEESIPSQCGDNQIADESVPSKFIHLSSCCQYNSSKVMDDASLTHLSIKNDQNLTSSSSSISNSTVYKDPNDHTNVTDNIPRKSTCNCEKNIDKSTSIGTNRSLMECSNLIKASVNSPTHKKTKSDSICNKPNKINNKIQKYHSVTTSSVITEENIGDLLLTNSDINSTKISLDLSAYNMDPSLINNIHIHIAVSIAKLENMKDMPKLDFKKYL